MIPVEGPGEGHGNPLQYSGLENPHGQRSLGGIRSMGGRKESDTSEQLIMHTASVMGCGTDVLTIV